ncbi:myosin-IIIa-like isoform X2 [Pomacea canaliculata]|uniref:myosin-IIIa-like isoform X2 n=1 Tax=Pomacea canaliculata TaxID=400727 RepID=UPI000D73C0E3|nr:myosin-IIIa-like isoform X2 [Pomacea canaliculata]
MAVPFSNTKLRVPKGFQNILEGLAREILRSQPSNIYEFGAEYFENMLKIRAETGHDPAVHGARLEDRYYNKDFKERSPQDYATRSYSINEEEAALRIQAGFRGYLGRMEVRNRKRMDSDENADFQQDIKDARQKLPMSLKIDRKDITPEPPISQDADLGDPEVANAALKIQSGFRGHMAREEIKRKKICQKTSSVTPYDTAVETAAAVVEATYKGISMRKSKGYIQRKLQKPGTYLHRMKEALETEVSQPQGVQEKEQEEVDIDLTDPEVEKAAIKIQAGFKGYKMRHAQNATSVKPVEEEEGFNKPDEVTAEISDQVKGEDSSLTDADREVAAIKIQASYRGYRTRKTLKGEPSLTVSKDATTIDKPEQHEEIDIDLTDPEVEKAAVKIQASFKGFKARKELSSSEPTQPDNSDEPGEGEGEVQAEDQGEGEEVDIDLTDPAVEQAAIKIQAGYKGFRARQEIKKKNEGVEDQEATGGDEVMGTDDTGEANDGENALEGVLEEDASKEKEVDDDDHGNEADEETGGVKEQSEEVGGEANEGQILEEEAAAEGEEAAAEGEEAVAEGEEAAAEGEEAVAEGRRSSRRGRGGSRRGRGCLRMCKGL